MVGWQGRNGWMVGKERLGGREGWLDGREGMVEW